MAGMKTVARIKPDAKDVIEAVCVSSGVPAAPKISGSQSSDELADDPTVQRILCTDTAARSRLLDVCVEVPSEQ